MKKILDWKEYEKTALETIAEGAVLLENKDNTLPLKKGSKISIFGRIQSSYYKSGTGSGGKVNVSKVYNIPEGIEECGDLIINKDLQKIYADWEKEHPYDEGLGWGQERWSQDEMPLTEKIVSDAAAVSDYAVVIIGRTAGEDKDNSATEGSYLLSKDEEAMIEAVTKGFNGDKKVIVLLNVGNIIDMKFVKKYHPDAVMYVWQGGMLGGLGTAKVLSGELSPSGKLTDTIANDINDYPSTANFGNRAGNIYAEDIFVGYRYFETFAKDKVLYPFGYGLTYTSFSLDCKSAENDLNGNKLSTEISVQNTGTASGKETVQLYIEAPMGKLGKAKKVLVDFSKTEILESGKIETLSFEIPYYNFASYDDSGITGNKSCYVLEKGKYTLYAGTDVSSCKPVLSFELPDLIIVKKCEEAYAPVKAFKRFHADEKATLIMEETPLASVCSKCRRQERLPSEIKQTTVSNITLKDVYDGKSTIENFVAQFSDEDLTSIIRGEGMGSSLVTPGTASAFGGVSQKLREKFGIPALCCDDGPSGMRLDCGIKAFALPNGTLIASTFNKKLVSKLYSFTGLEMIASKVDNLLGPGMNIHRSPLNGRNFEYLSEDPLVTGVIGSAIVKGLQSSGVTGTIKHFCGNNQEANRYAQDSVISERALREIYLKGFEIAVRNGADSVMTTYGMVNNQYTAVSYDLNTTLLRNEWGFKGIVMTDWWANTNENGTDPVKNNFAGMIRAQNDLYMVCPDGSKNTTGENTLTALTDGTLCRSELQRSAINICNHILTTEAMKRSMGIGTDVEIINRPKEADDINLEDVEFILLNGDTTFDLTYQKCKVNTNYIFAFDVQKVGTYEVTLTGYSDLNELAQLPCTLLYQGIPIASFTFHGTNGKEDSVTREVIMPTRFAVSRLTVAANGLQLKNIKFKYLNDNIKMPWQN